MLNKYKNLQRCIHEFKHTYMYVEWDHVQRLFFIMQRSERYENSRKPLASYYLLFSFNPHLQFVYNIFFVPFFSSSLLFSCVFVRWKKKLSERKIAIHVVLLKHEESFFIHFFFVFSLFFLQNNEKATPSEEKKS